MMGYNLENQFSGLPKHTGGQAYIDLTRQEMGINFRERRSYCSHLEERQPSTVSNHAYRGDSESDLCVPKEMKNLWTTSDETVLLKFAVSHLACIDYPYKPITGMLVLFFLLKIGCNK